MFGMRFSADSGFLSKARNLFRSREIFVHDGATMRRVASMFRVEFRCLVLA